MNNRHITSHKRTFQHEMETKSREMFQRLIPSHWVVRNYDYPDYGIDLSIEVFDKIDSEYSTTSGEHFFVQLKSTNACEHTKLSLDADFSIDVVKFTIETKSLHTARKMGTAAPLLLVLVCFKSEQIYYLCLNDYISSCDVRIRQGQNTKTIYIPKLNTLTPDSAHMRLRLYSTRAKLFSLFSLLEYQRSKILYMLDAYDHLKLIPPDKAQIKCFINEILCRDIWGIDHPWQGISLIHDEFIQPLKEYLETGTMRDTRSNLSTILDLFGEVNLVRHIWEQMCNLHSVFHEIIRQRELPTDIEGIFTKNN
ncbi:DUF4365 domain-containing protein [Fundidesulfovibrio putealis]|uniref:DUF4365 domain-containing protein n=1 Tax=Fundidesulfovibrio putealis TaxID=270496 RepID=UPI0009FFB195